MNVKICGNKQLEKQDYNSIRIDQPSPSEKKRDKKAKRIVGDDDEYHKKPKSQKLTKREEKLQMEQIKENLKAQKNPGYIPRDVFSEDRELRKKEEEEKLKKKEQSEDQEVDQYKQISKKRKKRIDEEDDDGEQEYQLRPSMF